MDFHYSKSPDGIQQSTLVFYLPKKSGPRQIYFPLHLSLTVVASGAVSLDSPPASLLESLPNLPLGLASLASFLQCWLHNLFENQFRFRARKKTTVIRKRKEVGRKRQSFLREYPLNFFKKRQKYMLQGSCRSVHRVVTGLGKRGSGEASTQPGTSFLSFS